jgi:hypothetical protein
MLDFFRIRPQKLKVPNFPVRYPQNCIHHLANNPNPVMHKRYGIRELPNHQARLVGLSHPLRSHQGERRA